MADSEKPPEHHSDCIPEGAYEDGLDRTYGVNTNVFDDRARITHSVSPNILDERGNELRSKMISAAAITVNLTKKYLIKHWIYAATMSVLYGPSHVGKTFMALDLAVHIACGVEWNGNRVTQGRVLYIACEGEAGISNRIAAVRQKLPQIDEAQFMLLPTKIDLFEGIDAEALAIAAAEFAPDLIIVDTMSRAMGAGDENKTQDMNRFVHSCDVLRGGTGAHLMIIHHSGKDAAKGMRGASALKAAIDVELEIDEDRNLTMHKQRDGKKQPTLCFDLKDVVLGVDDDGDEVSSATIHWPGEKPKLPKPKLTVKKLEGRLQVAFFTLDETIRRHGEMTKGHPDIPENVRHVRLEHWRREFYKRAFASDARSDTKLKGFNRALDKLLEHKLVCIFNDVAWTRNDAL